MKKQGCKSQSWFNIERMEEDLRELRHQLPRKLEDEGRILSPIFRAVKAWDLITDC